ncbi:hypothetical protein J4430_02155 [Candidatus Woesearchaeota archaeon]|nr:hypothetical protein [Candidatus Woesearchaeota archaeon]
MKLGGLSIRTYLLGTKEETALYVQKNPQQNFAYLRKAFLGEIIMVGASEFILPQSVSPYIWAVLGTDTLIRFGRGVISSIANYKNLKKGNNKTILDALTNIEEEPGLVGTIRETLNGTSVF